MESYILKNTEEKKHILMYEEKDGYTFVPKKGSLENSKVIVLDKKMIKGLLKNNVETKFNRLLKIFYSLYETDDTTSGDILATYREIDRLRRILLEKYYRYLDKKFIEQYLQKLQEMDFELKRREMISYYTYEEEMEEERGKSR